MNRKLLRVEAPSYVAGAVYALFPNGEWYCVLAAPILRKVALDRTWKAAFGHNRNCLFEWFDIDDDEGAQHVG